MQKLTSLFFFVVATSAFAQSSLNCRVETHRGLEVNPRIDTFIFNDVSELGALISWSPFSLTTLAPTQLVITDVKIARCPNCYEVVATDLKGETSEFTFKIRGIPGSFTRAKIDVQWRYLGPGPEGKNTSFSVKPGECRWTHND